MKVNWQKKAEKLQNLLDISEAQKARLKRKIERLREEIKTLQDYIREDLSK